MVMWKRYKRIHMVGIGGTGMSGIAEVLHNLGFVVTGSDLEKQKSTRRLARMGIKITYDHKPENVDGSEVTVISSAIRRTNPEVQRALDLKIPVIPRAEMLAELMRMKYSVAVSGAHGKTTCTSMIGKVLEAGMLICFGLSWPVSIFKSLRMKYVRGKSLPFMCLIFVGYLFGLSAKYLRAAAMGTSPELVTVLYGLNACFVGTEIFLYFRYRHRKAPFRVP